MRHAKSAWPIGVGDSERPLSARGERDAVAAGRAIAAELPTPDIVVLSTSRRTRQTMTLIESVLGPVPSQVDQRVYASTWWDLADVIHDTADSVTTLMLLGHNPGLEDLVGQLAAGGDEKSLRQLDVKFPTSAIAVLTGSRPWSQWNAGCARLDRLLVPRG